MLTKTVIITTAGEDASALEDAFGEATSQIMAGSTFGFDESATSSFTFEVDPPLGLQLTPRELDYLARAVDLGRSDPQASSILAPTERSDLLRKLGGRRA
jgi:hypothetical protein